MATSTRHRSQPQPGTAAYHDAQRVGRRILAEEETFCVFQARLLALVKEDVLTRHGYRVLFWLMADMEPGNYIYYSAAECARRMQMSYGTCWRAWQSLRLHGLLRGVYSENGYLQCWRVSPSLCWKGRPWKAARVAQREEQEDALARAAAAIGEV